MGCGRVWGREQQTFLTTTASRIIRLKDNSKRVKFRLEAVFGSQISVAKNLTFANYLVHLVHRVFVVCIGYNETQFI